MQQSCFHIHSDEKVLLELQWQGRSRHPDSTVEQPRLQITWGLRLRDWQGHSKDFKSRIVGFPVETVPSAKWKGLCEMILAAQLSWKLVVQKSLCALEQQNSSSWPYENVSIQLQVFSTFQWKLPQVSPLLPSRKGFLFSIFFDNTQLFYLESQTVWLQSSQITV